MERAGRVVTISDRMQPKRATWKTIGWKNPRKMDE